ncbi:MAG TPA: HoxN/HupN/NixA family nickel/cobalt transporter [Solirubrobacteraceae bacterium]|nr:HoxN/HupN/NixA family nickel/cobalt transporter [Solirubrobacteraceae bacterium]
MRTGQRRHLGFLGAAVAALHLAGFGTLLLIVVPHHLSLGGSGVFGIGLGLTAYTLGMRHAFDADHIAAIDNTTRKLMSEGQRPLSVGFWFSLGHSTVVFGLTAILAAGLRALGAQIGNGASPLHHAAGIIGAGVSGTFLYVIAGMNLLVLVSIQRAVREMRSGRFDESELEARLQTRGPMSMILGRLGGTIRRPWQMYPLGLLFGLGFDTATEVVLLFLAASAAGAGLPFYAVLCLPVLFAAGMSLLDTIDGAFMNVAYGWAFSQPVRKVFYNLAVTALTVVVAFAIGTVELGGVVAQQARAHGAFWSWLESINMSKLGFAIVGLFVVTWLVAMLIWRAGRVEERWGASRSAGDSGCREALPTER